MQRHVSFFLAGDLWLVLRPHSWKGADGPPRGAEHVAAIDLPHTARLIGGEVLLDHLPAVPRARCCLLFLCGELGMFKEGWEKYRSILGEILSGFCMYVLHFFII